MPKTDNEWFDENWVGIFDDYLQLYRSIPYEIAAPLCAASEIMAINRMLHSHENYTTEAWKIAIRAEVKDKIESYKRSFMMNSGDKNDTTASG